MKKTLTSPNYAYDPVGKTLNLSAIPNFSPARLYAVLDVTAGVILYGTSLPGLGASSFAGGILALEANTAGTVANDALMVIYDDGANDLTLGGQPLGQGNPLPMTFAKPPSASFGQVKIPTGGAAQQVPAGALVNGLSIKAGAANQGVIIVGSSNAVTSTNDGTGNGFPLGPGDEVNVSVADGSAVWIIGQAGDFIAYAKN